MAQLAVLFRPQALADIHEASLLYVIEDDGHLLERYFDAIDEAALRISKFPKSCPVYSENTRRILLNTFPYWMYYRITPDKVDILALIHVKREMFLLADE